MGFQFTPYILVMLSAAIVCILIGYYVWRHRDTPVDTLIIFIMMIAITEWLVASALGYATTDPASKIIWAKIEYVGVVSVPLLVFIFSVNYSGLKRRLSTRILIFIALVPAVTLLLTWTNEMHGLIWSRYIPYQENGLMFSNKIYGPGFWVYWIYSYLLLLAATILIIRTTLFSGKVFRGQAAVLTIGIILPWLGNAIYVLHISPLGNLDLTPLAFALTGSMLSLGIVRWHLFDIKPTAHVAVVENLTDGLILLNKHDRIIDINPAALHIFRVSSLETVGKQGSQILPAELFSNELRGSDGRIRIEMKLPYDQIERQYEITGTPFYDKLGELMGRILIVHDVTELKLAQAMLHVAERRVLEQKVGESEKKYEALFDNANDAIIIADTETGFIVNANREAETLLGRTRAEIISMHRSQIHPADKADYYSEHFRKHIETGKTIDFDAEIVRKDGGVMPVAISASVVQLQGKSVIQGIFRDMTARKRAENVLKEGQQILMAALYKMIEAMTKITATRDPFTAQHQRRVSELSVQIALGMGLPEQRIKALEVAALIHDIGKLYISSDILNKPGKLNEFEMGIVKTHVQAGYDILSPIEFPWPIKDIVRQHHERLDGSGYPSGLKNDEICIEAKILAVADTVEAMASHRPYRPALGIDKALDEISKNRGRIYDADVVDACLGLFSSGRFEFKAV